MKRISVGEITRQYLVKNKFDGLGCEYCSCDLDDLFPCEGDEIQNCEAGYKVKCDPEFCSLGGCGDYHIGEKE